MRRTTALMSQCRANKKQGEYIQFRNCKGGYFSKTSSYALRVVGKTRQNTLSGINLLNPQIYANAGNGNMTVALSDNKIILTANNNISTITLASVDITNLLTVGKAYTFSCEYLSDFGKMNLDIMDATTNTRDFVVNSKVTFTAAENKVYKLKLYINDTGGSIAQGEQIIYDKLGLYNTEDGVLPQWEAYCGGIPSPNPDFPQEISCVKKDTVIRCYGKNLLNPITTDGNINGVTWKVIKPGYIKISGTPTEYVSIGSWENIPNSNCTYSLSHLNLESGVVFQINGYDRANKKVYTNSFNLGGSFTLSSEIAHFSVTLKRRENNVPIDVIIAPQLEIGQLPTGYEPYICNEITVPCDLYEKDAWLPSTGKIFRYNKIIDSYNGEYTSANYVSTTGQLSQGAKVIYRTASYTTESVTPQPIFAPQGIVTIIQYPLELSAELSATMLTVT